MNFLLYISFEVVNFWEKLKKSDDILFVIKIYIIFRKFPAIHVLYQTLNGVKV